MNRIRIVPMASRAILAVAAVVFAAALIHYGRSSAKATTTRVPPLPVQSRGGALLVVYQPADCTSFVKFIRGWADLVDSAAGFRVIGVPVNVEDTPFDRVALEDISPAFPVMPELAEAALARVRGMRGIRTPAAIYVDSLGRPRLVIEATDDPERMARARDLVREYRSLSYNKQ
jgi:hypothetical protein